MKKIQIFSIRIGLLAEFQTEDIKVGTRLTKKVFLKLCQNEEIIRNCSFKIGFIRHFNVESDSVIKNLLLQNILIFWFWFQNLYLKLLFYFEKNICDSMNSQLSKMPKIFEIGPHNPKI